MEIRTESHRELYEYLKQQDKAGLGFSRPALFEIYNSFVVPNKRPTDSERLTEEQIYHNFSSWLNYALVALIRQDCFLLIFKDNRKRLK
jgi:hypothetical protein